MIGHLHGTVVDIYENNLIISVMGVGYEVACPHALITSATMDEHISVYTHLAVRETALDLYGFGTKQELEFFQLLITISGIGPKVGLSIINAALPETLYAAIKQKDTSVAFTNVQDMLSSFYYLRNRNVKNMKKGDEIAIDMFMDSQVYPFKLRFLGKETISTKFGKVKTLIFRPMVQSGRVFKAQESVTLWITDDENKIPIKMKADLSVGSLRAELEQYKGLANAFSLKK